MGFINEIKGIRGIIKPKYKVKTFIHAVGRAILRGLGFSKWLDEKDKNNATQVDTAYSTHLPVLLKVLSLTKGDILEMGVGQFSTPLLHWLCYPNRKLVSYEDVEQYYDISKSYQCDFHDVKLVDNYDDADIERFWDVAFIDHAADRRAVEIKRLANFAKYIVVHDTQPNNEFSYGLEEIYPLFKYRYDFKGAYPNTSVLSNFVDLTDFDL